MPVSWVGGCHSVVGVLACWYASAVGVLACAVTALVTPGRALSLHALVYGLVTGGSRAAHAWMVLVRTSTVHGLGW